MTDRVTDDGVASLAGTLARAGATRRLELRIPDSGHEFPTDDVVRVVLDGSEYRARVAATADGTPAFRGAYDTPSQARDPGSGENRLAEWVDSKGLDAGRSVHVDVVEPEFKYGVRAPGESATYQSTGTPDSTLSAIADSLDE
jgi:hypothetical protein